jgi:HEAT repeat protein/ATP/ADP translocase
MSIGSRLVALRPGEGRIVALLAALFATVEAGRGLGEVSADTLFISRFGAESLPYLYVGLGLVSMVVALAYGAAIGRFDRRRVLVGVLIGFAAIVLVERVAVMSGALAVLPAVWISVYVIGAILLTILWTVAGSTLDVRQAKRLFPACTSAAIVGGFVGTLAAGPLARAVGTENLLVLFAALLLGSAAITAATVRGPVRPTSRGVRAGSLAAELRVGFDHVRRSPMMRLVAAAYVLFAVLLFSVSFPFLRAMGDAFESEADLATALGLLSAAVTGVSFLVSVAVANRLYTRIGIAGAALALPLVYLAGFGLWFVQFNLVTAMVVRFSQQVTQRGISNAAWSALYNVVPAQRRAQVLAFIDGVPGQIGTTLSGLLLLVVGALLAETQIFVMGAVAAVAATWIVLRIRARYGQALVSTLRSGLAEQVLEGGPGIAALAREPYVREALRAALGSAVAGERRLAATLVGRLGDVDAADALAATLDDPDPDVRSAGLTAVAAVDGQRLLRIGPRLAHDPSPAVRAELAVCLAQAGDAATARALMDGLAGSPAPDDRAAWYRAAGELNDPSLAEVAIAGAADASPGVRAAAIRAIGSLETWTDGALAVTVRALDDDALRVRRAASMALADRDDSTATLLQVLRTGSDRSQEAALLALGNLRGGTPHAVRDWAVDLMERARQLRRLTLLPDGPIGTSQEFLRFVIAHRADRTERRVLAAISALGAPEAGGTIRRALRSGDTDVRAQAIEALDVLGDPRLGRELARLVERDPGRPDADDALQTLRTDPDPWIRGLALRTIGERDPMIAASSAERAAQDPDPIVDSLLARFAAPRGDAMADTDQTLGAVERMLFLRRVPLFSRLAPEDLQRIAATATERLYEPHEPLVEEGDLGDELVVIVEGDVMVVQTDGRDARLIRAYTVGDHVGELAILRAQPRVASVIACDEGVRGLVIGGDGLRAILEERPEAALAMLATLADRISTQ